MHKILWLVLITQDAILTMNGSIENRENLRPKYEIALQIAEKHFPRLPDDKIKVYFTSIDFFSEKKETESN